MTNTLKDLFKVSSFKIYRNKIDKYIGDYYQNLSDEDLGKAQRLIVKAPPTVTPPSINEETPIVPTPSNICDIPLTVTTPPTSVGPLTVATLSTSVEPPTVILESTVATPSTSGVTQTIIGEIQQDTLTLDDTPVVRIYYYC